MKTLVDAATELGITKSTVSRALSGRGRVSEETRRKIQEWVQENNYSPNSIARSLAEGKTYNIAVVLSGITDNIFSQRCLVGIAKSIVHDGYDALAVIDYGDDISSLERVIRNRKVDGVILTRIVKDDKIIKLLKKESIPFVVIGTSTDRKLYQIDADHRIGSYELARWFLQQGVKRPVLLGGGESYLVNRQRYEGFKEVFGEDGIVIWNVWTDSDDWVAQALAPLIEKNIDGIVCMDDAICYHVISWLKHRNYFQLPVISFYGAPWMEQEERLRGFLFIDSDELGRKAGNAIVSLLQGQKLQKRMIVPYKLTIKNN